MAEGGLELRLARCLRERAFFVSGDTGYVIHVGKEHCGEVSADDFELGRDIEVEKASFEHTSHPPALLSEPGKSFSSMEEAAAYVSAVWAFDEYVTAAASSLDPVLGAKRADFYSLFREAREKINSKHLGVLEDIPAFGEFMPWLSVEPERIAVSAKAMVNGFSSGVPPFISYRGQPMPYEVMTNEGKVFAGFYQCTGPNDGVWKSIDNKGLIPDVIGWREQGVATRTATLRYTFGIE